MEATKQVHHPEWSRNAIIYEVNIRQYTPEGTLKAFEKSLPRLKATGIDILWLMPVQPIGKVGRKGSLGSYYAIEDFKSINPEFGKMEDYKQLVKHAHELGFKVLMDWVANHTSPDHVWVNEHRDYYVLDENGNPIQADPGWTDVVKLKYDNPALREAMTEAMEWWMKEADIDGFRCDMAMLVPTDFWINVRKRLDDIKPVFMLAEAEEPDLHQAFDATYTWKVFHAMNDVAAGHKSLEDFNNLLNYTKSIFPGDAYRMYFTVNHDENSWNGTEFEMMKDGARTFAVMTFLLPGIPMIYSGQECANHKRLAFFEKDTIPWGDFIFQDFYAKLAKLKHENKALIAGASPSFGRLPTDNDEHIYALQRQYNTDKVIAILNLSPKAQKVTLQQPQEGIFHEIFTEKEMNVNQQLQLLPWQYLVLEKR